MRNKAFAVIVFLCIIPQTALASRAGLVVKHSNGEVVKSCIEFKEEVISGLALLELAGMRPVLDGGFVIEIDGERTKTAWSMNSADPYWSYWIYNDGWQYSNFGAVYSKVKDGEVQGWEIGKGQNSLPELSFDALCPGGNRETNRVLPVVAEISQVGRTSDNNKENKPLSSGDGWNQDPILERGLIEPAKNEPINRDEEVAGAATDKINPDKGKILKDGLQNRFLDLNVKNGFIMFFIVYLGGIVFFLIRYFARKFVS